MSGRRSRDKGAREERAIVRAHVDAGFVARRVPLSGAGYEKDDCTIELGDEVWRVEAKHQEKLPKRLWEWLDGTANVLTLRRNQHGRLYVVDEATWFRLLHALERFESGKP